MTINRIIVQTTHFILAASMFGLLFLNLIPASRHTLNWMEQIADNGDSRTIEKKVTLGFPMAFYTILTWSDESKKTDEGYYSYVGFAVDLNCLCLLALLIYALKKYSQKIE